MTTPATPPARPRFQRVDPQALVADLEKPQFGKMLLWAALVHLVLIGISSISFVTLCVKYDTIRPHQEMRRRQKALIEEQAKAEAEKQIAAAKQAAKPGAKPADAAPATGDATPADGAPATGDKPKSPIEKKVEESSTDLPTKSGVKMDSPTELE